MRIIAKSTLRVFWERTPTRRSRCWRGTARSKRKIGPTVAGEGEVPECKFRQGNRVVFNIKGNDYRLVVKINYPYRVIYVRFVGTHAEYDADRRGGGVT